MAVNSIGMSNPIGGGQKDKVGGVQVFKVGNQTFSARQIGEDSYAVTCTKKDGPNGAAIPDVMTKAELMAYVSKGNDENGQKNQGAGAIKFAAKAPTAQGVGKGLDFDA